MVGFTAFEDMLCQEEIVAVLDVAFRGGLGARAWCPKCGKAYELTWVMNKMDKKNEEVPSGKE
jgi:hypothetical protein